MNTPYPVTGECGHPLGTLTGPFLPQLWCDDCGDYVWPRRDDDPEEAET